MPSPKPDHFPEYSNWQDKGCELCPSCLNCTLPRCIEDEPRGRQKLRMATRAQTIIAMKKSGITNKEIALSLHLNIRTIQRAVATIKDENRHRRYPK